MSVPLKSRFGVYRILPLSGPSSVTSTAVPFAGAVTEPAFTLSASRSTSVSLPAAATATAVSSSVLAASSTATGASFTATTVTDTRPTSVSVPSETV